MDAKLFDISNSTADNLVWRMINGEKDRMRESLEEVPLPAPNDCLSVILDLFIHTSAHSEPQDALPNNQAIDNAMTLASLLTNASSAIPYNMSHHFAALAAMVLVDALKKHDRKDEVFARLQQFHQALLNGEIVIAAGDRWITPLKSFLMASIQHHLGGANGVPSGPDRAGLQHLADAAVGETETAAGGGSRRGSNEYGTVTPRGYLTMLARFV